MNGQPMDLAGLEAAAEVATHATKAAADKVAEIENQLAAARQEWDTAKEREMEARRAFSMAKDAPAAAG